MESISGRKAEKRHDFQRMIGLAKTKPRPFSVIIVWKYSRFARNQEESIVYKSLLRRQCGIDVLSVSEPLVDGPFGLSDRTDHRVDGMNTIPSVSRMK